MKTSQVGYNFNVKEALRNYTNKRYSQLCKTFIGIFLHFDKVWYSSWSRDDLLKLEEFVATFLYIWTRPDFQIPKEFNNVFSNIGHLVANVVSMTSYSTTDGAVGHLLTQKNNYYKLLPLLSVYNSIQLPFKYIIDADPVRGTLWWLTYQTATPGSLTQDVHNRMVKQYHDLPEKIALPDGRVSPLYFQVSYFAPEKARDVKSMFNKQISQQIKETIISKPDPKSIAIVTGRWQKTTAVYKSLSPQVHELAKTYDLTLVHFGAHEGNIDTSGFKNIVKVNMQPNFAGCDIEAIKENNFQLAYFPDIGMNFESTWLSNLKIAPIMVTGYGHPVSTHGSCVDYFIGGAEVEDVTRAKENYDEKLVVIPGLGCHPVDPLYERKGKKPSDEILINCCWTTHKINYPMLKMLQSIQQLSKKPVKFQFFPSWTIGKYNNLIYFIKTLDQFFGKNNWKYFTSLKYHDYLTEVEKADFTIDSYPFGGYNTVIDSFFAGCPVLAIEGTQFANRASSALLRRVGLNELITTNSIDCASKAIELVNDSEYLGQMRSNLNDVNQLRRLLINTDEPKYFVEAIDYLIKNHDDIQNNDLTSFLDRL
jgi:hypothetical protein